MHAPAFPIRPNRSVDPGREELRHGKTEEPKSGEVVSDLGIGPTHMKPELERANALDHFISCERLPAVPLPARKASTPEDCLAIRYHPDFHSLICALGRAIDKMRAHPTGARVAHRDR